MKSKKESSNLSESDLDGFIEDFHANKNIASQKYFKNGVKIGTHKYFFRHGKLQKEIFYEKGKEVGRKEYKNNSTPTNRYGFIFDGHEIAVEGGDYSLHSEVIQIDGKYSRYKEYFIYPDKLKFDIVGPIENTDRVVRKEWWNDGKLKYIESNVGDSIGIGNGFYSYLGWDKTGKIFRTDFIYQGELLTKKNDIINAKDIITKANNDLHEIIPHDWELNDVNWHLNDNDSDLNDDLELLQELKDHLSLLPSSTMSELIDGSGLNEEDDYTKKYENLNDVIDYNNIVFINDFTEFLDVDFKQQDIELYFECMEPYSGCYWQCKKSKENKNTEIISKWSDDYLLDGNEHLDLKNLFDESNEIHEYSTCYAMYLSKINSVDFLNKFRNKIIEWVNTKSEEEFPLDFLSWLEYDMFSASDADQHIDSFYNSIAGDVPNEDLQEIFDGVDVDEKRNKISWLSFTQLENAEFRVGYKYKK